jgi:DNA-binding CsgD family transcriptional regulator
VTRNDDLEALGLLYDAALGHADWSDVGACLASLVDGATLTFTAQYAPTAGIDFVDMKGVTPKEIELYATQYLADDLWRNAAIGRQIVDRVVLNSDLVDDLEWGNSRIYSELCRPNTDIFHGVMVTGTLPGQGLFSLGIHRPRNASPFKAAAAGRLQRLLPHIGRALQVRSRLGLAGAEQRASMAVLDRLAFGVIQLGARGMFVSANAAARRILDRGDGLTLSRLGLRAASPGDDTRLQRAISRAGGLTAAMAERGEAGGHLRVQRPSGAKPYSVIVTPLGLDRVCLSPRQPVTMLIVTDPDSDLRLDLQGLQALFGFTPAEARLVGLLVAGRSLPDVAKELGIGFETARTHLARARAKTETKSQIDLVRTVLLAVSPLRASSR